MHSERGSAGCPFGAKIVVLMHVQATVADPCFDLVDGLGAQKLSDSQWAKLEDMGTRLQATATRAKTFSMGGDFDRYNGDMGAEAARLVTHATGRDRTKALASVGSIRQSCRACHKQYK